MLFRIGIFCIKPSYFEGFRDESWLSNSSGCFHFLKFILELLRQFTNILNTHSAPKFDTLICNKFYMTSLHKWLCNVFESLSYLPMQRKKYVIAIELLNCYVAGFFSVWSVVCFCVRELNWRPFRYFNVFRVKTKKVCPQN